MALNKLYLAALVIFAVIFIFQIVALSGVYQGWFGRKTIQPSAPQSNGEKYITELNMDYGTIGWCSNQVNGSTGIWQNNGCDSYYGLLSQRGDQPPDGAVQGVIRGGRAAITFNVFAVITSGVATLSAAGLLFKFGPPLFRTAGVASSIANVIFSLLAWSIMLGMHKARNMQNTTCGLSELGLRYAFVLMMLSTIFGLFGTPIFMVANQSSSSRFEQFDDPNARPDTTPYTLMDEFDPGKKK